MAENNDFSSYNPASFFSFLSGARLGRLPLGYQAPRPAPYIHPSTLPSDKTTLIATALGGVGTEHFEFAIRGLIGAQDVERSFGSKDRLLQMNYDYLNRTKSDVAEADTIFRELGITNQSEFNNKFEAWLKNYHVEQNEQRFWAGRPLLEGLGTSKDLGPIGNALHPMKALQSLAANELQHQTINVVENLTNSSPEYTDIHALTKVEQARYIEGFLRSSGFKYVDYLKDKIADPTTTPTERARFEADLTRWSGYMDQYKNDFFIPDERSKDKVSPISRMSYSFKRQILDQGQLIRTMRTLNRHFTRWSRWANEIQRDPVLFAIKAPFRLLWHYYLRYALYRPIRKIWDDFVRNTLKEIPYVGKYLSNAFRGIYFSKGTRGLTRGLTYRGANLLGRTGATVINVLAKAAWQGAKVAGKFIVASAGRALAAAAALAIGPEAIAAIIITIVIGLLVLGVFLMMPFISLDQFFKPAQACGAPPRGVVLPKSTEMLQYVFQVAQQNTKGCVPAGLILSLASIEAGSFNYTDQQFTKYSTPGWWGSASAQDLQDGYANNTCDKTYQDPNTGQTLKLCNADVRGIMQFEENTFNFYAKQFPPDITSNHTPDRRNAKDAIYAAALFIRDHSGITDPKDCGANWSQDTINKIAGAYCGNSCNGFQAQCGSDYCGQAYNGYLSYKEFTDCGGGGSQAILTAIKSLDRSKYGEFDCLLMVDDALASIRYKNFYGYNAASEVFDAGPSQGYQQFVASPHQIPQPGDLVLWGGGYGGDGHIAVVDHTTTQSGTTYVYVYDNLVKYNGGNLNPYILQGDQLRGAGGFTLGGGYFYQGFLRATDKAK